MDEHQSGARQPDMTILTASVTECDGVAVVRLVGEIDMATVARAEAAIQDAVERANRVVLDMSELRFFSSAGLNLLVRLRQEAQRRDLDIRLAAVAPAVLRPIELMGLADLFPIYVSAADALASPAH
jgi:anti-sigma B factor antagonist